MPSTNTTEFTKVTKDKDESRVINLDKIWEWLGLLDPGDRELCEMIKNGPTTYVKGGLIKINADEIFPRVQRDRIRYRSLVRTFK